MYAEEMKVKVKVKVKDGFYAGNGAFNLIKNQIGANATKDMNVITYNGFKIFLDPMLENGSVIGIGEPYASIAKQMAKMIEQGLA